MSRKRHPIEPLVPYRASGRRPGRGQEQPGGDPGDATVPRRIGLSVQRRALRGKRPPSQSNARRAAAPKGRGRTEGPNEPPAALRTRPPVAFNAARDANAAVGSMSSVRRSSVRCRSTPMGVVIVAIPLIKNRPTCGFEEPNAVSINTGRSVRHDRPFTAGGVGSSFGRS